MGRSRFNSGRNANADGDDGDAEWRSLLRRLERLGLRPSEFLSEDELCLLQEGLAPDLHEIVLSRIAEVEQGLLDRPFVPPPSDDSVRVIDEGDILIATTIDGQPVSVRFDSHGAATQVVHMLIAGMTASGKSTAQARIALEAAPYYATLIVDSTRFYRGVAGIERTHAIARWEHSRLNAFDACDVPEHSLDQVMDHEFCRSNSLQFAEYEISEVVEELRRHGTPNWLAVLQGLREKRGGSYKRAQYRDSAILVLGNLLRATKELFACSEGMSILELCRSNVVLEVDGLLPQHQAYLIRLIFEYLSLAARTHRLKRPLLFMLDEGQILAGQEGFAEKLLQLRHLNVHLIANVQNPSRVPVEWAGNCDAVISFALTDERDRRAIGGVTGLNKAQQDYLSQLAPGECVAFLPRWEAWKRPFLAKVPEISRRKALDDATVVERSARFMSQFAWTPLPGSAGVGQQRATAKAEAADRAGADAAITPAETARVRGGVDTVDSESSLPGERVDREAVTAGTVGGAWNEKRSEAETRFLYDVLTHAHEFSALGARHIRAGVRSAAQQIQIVRALLTKGLIRIEELSIGRGRPVRLVEGTERAFELLGVKPWRKGRGSLRTRAATWFLIEKFRKLGLDAVEEGMVDGKAVDAVVRDGERLVTVEVAGSSGHERHNALHCVRCSDVDKHYVVCLSREILEAVKQGFGEMLELAEDARVEVLMLAQALKAGWRP